MGAEFYIPSAFDERHRRHGPKLTEFADKFKAAVNGRMRSYYRKMLWEQYDEIFGRGGSYRDAYSDRNLLWKLGLDYGGWLRSLLDDEGLLHPDKAALVRHEVENRGHRLEEIEDNEERKYFKEKFEQFVELLGMAIKMGEPIKCLI